MAAFKTISGKHIPARIFNNSAVSNSNWLSACKEWIGSGVRFIGKHAGYDITICKNVEVINHIVCYPSNMEGLIAVVHNGFTLPLSADLSGIGLNCKLNQSTTNLYGNDILLELNGLKNQLNELNGIYAITPTQAIVDKINDVTSRILKDEEALSVYKIYSDGRKGHMDGEFYNTKLNCIQVSFATGFVDIIARVLKVDEEGWLDVIDDEYNLQAIHWYVLLMLCENGYKHHIFDWQMCYDQFWGNHAKGIISWKAKAANSLKAPTIDSQERFLRIWTAPKLNRDAYNIQFSGLEQPTGFIH